MSLTSLLNGRQSQHKEFQSILRNILPKRESFETISGKSVFSKKSYETLVPYYLEKKDNASVIGIAFDYLARVMISRVVKQNHQEVYINTKAEFSL